MSAPMHLRLDRLAVVVRALASALDHEDIEMSDARDGLDHVHDSLRALAVELENADHAREREARAHREVAS